MAIVVTKMLINSIFVLTFGTRLNSIQFFTVGECHPGKSSSSTKVRSCAVFDSMMPNWLQFSFIKLTQNWQFLARIDFKLRINFISGTRGEIASLGV